MSSQPPKQPETVQQPQNPFGSPLKSVSKFNNNNSPKIEKTVNKPMLELLKKPLKTTPLPTTEANPPSGINTNLPFKGLLKKTPSTKQPGVNPPPTQVGVPLKLPPIKTGGLSPTKLPSKQPGESNLPPPPIKHAPLKIKNAGPSPKNTEVPVKLLPTKVKNVPPKNVPLVKNVPSEEPIAVSVKPKTPVKSELPPFKLPPPQKSSDNLNIVPKKIPNKVVPPETKDVPSPVKVGPKTSAKTTLTPPEPTTPTNNLKASSENLTAPLVKNTPPIKRIDSSLKIPPKSVDSPGEQTPPTKMPVKKMLPKDTLTSNEVKKVETPIKFPLPIKTPEITKTNIAPLSKNAPPNKMVKVLPSKEVDQQPIKLAKKVAKDVPSNVPKPKVNQPQESPPFKSLPTKKDVVPPQKMLPKKVPGVNNNEPVKVLPPTKVPNKVIGLPHKENPVKELPKKSPLPKKVTVEETSSPKVAKNPPNDVNMPVKKVPLVKKVPPKKN
eukprot:TRINITY_DN128_c1_g1_i2.p1 TRINITY_DN128_c1_g1~~TRINITY_DN128_c1_g1_i2.p1  ORF type:complete len:493 (+),score=233.69 TRINITY_DN128_c1_g1_i2:1758-3236(+)